MKYGKMNKYQIGYIEKILRLDKLNGLYQINANFLDDSVDYTKMIYTPFNIRGKIICSHDKMGLIKYHLNKKDHDLFNPFVKYYHAELLTKALFKFNPNFKITVFKEGDLYYAKILDENNEIVLETEYGYYGTSCAQTIVILKNWGYDEDKGMR